MHLDTPALNLDGSGVNVRLDRTPDSCPRCHHNVHPKFLLAQTLGAIPTCQAAFRCTNHQCQEMFLATYSFYGENGGRRHYRLRGVSPVNAKSSEFPEVIQEVSPSFCAIFNQAEQAEAAELEQLVGIGLRKALEFLVKDFAASENPGKELEIRRTMLGPCIAQFINDTNVKECAKRAAWLGNDETHYTRKWESKDVNDLKLLVRLTVNWIESSLLTKKYISEMQASSA
jgi:hypothetical protein